MLIEKNVNIDVKDYVGQTALANAAGNGHETIVKLLLEKGADIKIVHGDQATPVSHAIGNGHEVIV